MEAAPQLTGRQLAQQRYRNSLKGIEAKKRYNDSDKGRITNQRAQTNWLHTPKGKAYTARYNARRKAERLVAFNNKYHPEMGDEAITYEEWIDAKSQSVSLEEQELIRRRQLVNTLLAKVRANSLAQKHTLTKSKCQLMDNQTGSKMKMEPFQQEVKSENQLRQRRICKNSEKRDRHNIVVNK